MNTLTGVIAVRKVRQRQKQHMNKVHPFSRELVDYLGVHDSVCVTLYSTYLHSHAENILSLYSYRNWYCVL